MAVDNTPPRLRLIMTIAVIVLVTLVSLDFVFKGYYTYMTEEAASEKLAPPKALTEQHLAETAAFAGAKVPLEQATRELAKGRSPLIEPTASEDQGAMTGWSKMPKVAPQADPRAASEPAPRTHGGSGHTPGPGIDGGGAGH